MAACGGREQPKAMLALRRSRRCGERSGGDPPPCCPLRIPRFRGPRRPSRRGRGAAPVRRKNFPEGPDALGRRIEGLKNICGREEVDLSGSLMMVILLILGVKLGAAAGPNLPKLIAAGPALILQEFGNLGTIFLGLPVALLLGMGREGFGATVSICREDTLGLIGERYGRSSPEGMGTMGTYMVGSLFGTIFFGLLASIGLMTGLHPYALAMACGVGSATMMTASSQALAAALPEMSEEILAYAATSNICSSIDGLYMTLFLGIPIANFIYKKMAGKKK